MEALHLRSDNSDNRKTDNRGCALLWVYKSKHFISTLYVTHTLNFLDIPYFGTSLTFLILAAIPLLSTLYRLQTGQLKSVR